MWLIIVMQSDDFTPVVLLNKLFLPVNGMIIDKKKKISSFEYNVTYSSFHLILSFRKF